MSEDLDEVASRVLKKAARSSPWLLLSLVFHGALLGVLPFVIWSEQMMHERDATPITITLDAKRIDPERSYKPVDSGPPSFDGRGLEEPPVFFPDAKLADRNESAGKDEGPNPIDGESMAALSHLEKSTQGGWKGRMDVDGPGLHDSIGVGGGAGRGSARYGAGPGGWRADAVARGGGSAATEAGVEAGLVWLARHQNGNGSWGAAKLRCDKCSPAANVYCQDEWGEVGGTALAICAFLAAGYNPESREGRVVDRSTGATLRFPVTVKAALGWIVSQQQPDGAIGSAKLGAWTHIYSHAFATMALCEATRMTHGGAYREPAQKAIRWLEKAQSPVGGWRYSPRCPDSDMSVTAACVQALRSARMAHLEVSPPALEGVGKFLDSCSKADGSTDYMPGTTFRGSGCSAIGIFVRRFLQPTTADKRLAAAARLVEKTICAEGYSYTYYYSMLALFELEGPTGPSWRAVNRSVTTQLVGSQSKRGCAEGSWEEELDPTKGVYCGGRVVTTAMNVLTLEVYYRYEPGKKP